MAVPAGENLFRVIKDQFHRSAGYLRQEISDGNVNERCFRTKISTHMDDVNFYLLFRNSKVFRHLVTQPPWPLVRSPDFDFAVGMDLDRASAGFDIAVVR